MAKRYLSDDEYQNQQFGYRHELLDPSLMASVIDKDFSTDPEEEEETKQKKQDLQDKLTKLVKLKIEKNLTARQREAIYLSFMGKKQEHMGAILGISQEAVHTRLKLGVQKLTEICTKDDEIQGVILEIDQL